MTYHKPLRHAQSGVMLLEALIAILIFSLGILALIGLQATAISQSTDARYRSEAALLANDIEIEHACEMSCACTTCHVIVREGFASLGEPDELEEDMLDRAWGLEPNSRLSCQAIVAETPLVIEIPKYTINHARENH